MQAEYSSGRDLGIKALVEATDISISLPELVYNTPSTLKVRSESLRLTMARLLAPWARTISTVRLVSVVVPDWLMATTSVFSMVLEFSPSQPMLNPESSDAFWARMFMVFPPR